MRNRYLLILIFTALAVLQCGINHKISYNIPANYPETRRQEILAQCEKGKELFKTNCSECHGIFTKGQDKIPNFTTIQLDNYSARFMHGDPKNHAVARKMSSEQMNEVLVFLRYKKIKGVTDTTVSSGRQRMR